MKYLLTVVLLLVSFVAGENQQEFSYWSAQVLANYGERLTPKMDADKRAVQELASFGSHSVLMVYRESSAAPAVHDGTDFYVVQGGKASLVLGGELIDPHPKGPTEVWGTSIKGGKNIDIQTGDVINIPPRVPHQIILKPGDSISYLVVKIH